MHIIFFLIIGLSVLSLQAQAESTGTVPEESPTSIEIDTITNAKVDPNTPSKNHPVEAPVVITTDQPVGTSMQEALAAPDDSYVEGKDLNAEDEPDPDETDEADEEDLEDETMDEEE